MLSCLRSNPPVLPSSQGEQANGNPPSWSKRGLGELLKRIMPEILVMSRISGSLDGLAATLTRMFKEKLPPSEGVGKS